MSVVVLTTAEAAYCVPAEPLWFAMVKIAE
jgi:hypothetical protein